MKNSPLCAHVLHKTLNLVISRCCFADDGKGMYQNMQRTCKAIVFVLDILGAVTLQLLPKAPLG